VIAMTTSFRTDIAPILEPFRDNMLWRFDLADYDAVKPNAQLIMGRLTGATGTQMPPPPMPPLTSAQIALFKQWMAEGCPQ
jgi:hypothetical protein